jgi:transposase-like protein
MKARVGGARGYFKPRRRKYFAIIPLDHVSVQAYIGFMAKPKTTPWAEIQRRFPDDDACLDHIFRVRYGERFDCPRCEREARYYRIKGKRERRVYACEWCDHHISPLVGTPFEKTRIPLTSWFRVMHMFITTRNGVPAKEIQRVIGCTYKCAFRMGHAIRSYMGYVDGDAPIGGPGSPPVELDKAFVGGRDKMGADDKKVVLGMLERGGDVVAKHIPDRTAQSVEPVVLDHVKPGSRVMTDEAGAFRGLRDDYEVHTVNHRAGEYVRGDVHVNSLEGFWANVKRGVSGTYVHVSQQHTQKYLYEFEYRHNFRHAPHLMFEALVLSFAPPKAKAAS